MVFLGITDLGINVPTLIGQTVNFIVLLIVLRLVVYKPVLNLLENTTERHTRGQLADIDVNVEKILGYIEGDDDEWEEEEEEEDRPPDS